MHGEIRARLSGGDFRSIGQANEIAEWIAQDPERFSLVFDMIWSDDALAAMRAADAVEKAAKKYPPLLRPHTPRLLESLPQFRQQELQWHAALLLGYADLEADEIHCAVAVLREWLDSSESAIVKVNCLQALTDITIRYGLPRSGLRDLLSMNLERGSAALKARCRKLLKLLDRK